VFAASVRAIVADVVGKVIVVASVPANVSDADQVRFFELATPDPPWPGVTGLARLPPVICVHVFAAVHRCRFWPAVEFDLK
jgi:hypothetical protein